MDKSFSGSQIPDPEVKKAPDPGSGSATLNKKEFFGSGSRSAMDLHDLGYLDADTGIPGDNFSSFEIP
jgi:hypothetical protein